MCLYAQLMFFLLHCMHSTRCRRTTPDESCILHAIKMDHQRIPQQALYWEVPDFKRPANDKLESVVRKIYEGLWCVTHLGREEGSRPHQWRMVSECGPSHYTDVGSITVKVNVTEFCEPLNTSQEIWLLRLVFYFVQNVSIMLRRDVSVKISMPCHHGFQYFSGAHHWTVRTGNQHFETSVCRKS